MIIENVNTGVCAWRAQNNLPCFFVNWVQDGVNMYEFFSIVSFREKLKDRLKQQLCNTNEELNGNAK